MYAFDWKIGFIQYREILEHSIFDTYFQSINIEHFNGFDFCDIKIVDFTPQIDVDYGQYSVEPYIVIIPYNIVFENT